MPSLRSGAAIGLLAFVLLANGFDYYRKASESGHIATKSTTPNTESKPAPSTPVTSPTQESQNSHLLDPRTTEKKIPSSEFPSKSTEKRIAFNRPLHVLSLGGSVTWGAMNAGSRRQDAYPYVLASEMLPPNSTVTNIAVRATGADLAALCLQSMVLDQVEQNPSILDSKDGHDIDYDIITVEYSINGIDNLDILLRRLRRRFPRAVIIYIHLYSWMVSAVDEISNNTAMDIRDQIWKDRDRETAWQWGHELVNKTSYQWSWRHDPGREERQKDNLDFIRRELRRINGFLYILPKHNEASNALAWFADDLHHLNEAGHTRVAHDVASIIDTHSSLLDLQSQEPSPGWGDGGDQCISWYSSGSSNQVHVNKDIIPFAPSKYAVEVTMEDRSPLLLEVNNSYSVKMPLALSTMSHERVYPKAMVVVTPGSNGNAQNNPQRGTLLDPLNRIPGFRGNHVVQSQFIGYLEPGHNIISITPVETTDKPLRITGVMICRQCGLEEMVPRNGTEEDPGLYLSAETDVLVVQRDRLNSSDTNANGDLLESSKSLDMQKAVVINSSKMPYNTHELGRTTRPFRPRLQFTDNAVWEEDSSGPDISLQLLRRDQYYALPAHIIVGDAVSFVISGFPCNKDSHNKGVLIWFESIETRVVLSAPALPRLNGDLVAKVVFQDSGEYRVHVVGYNRTKKEEGARGTISKILPVRQSPWAFTVIPQDFNPMTQPTVQTKIFLPRNTCNFSDLETSGNGRWIECASGGIHQSQCLTGGWIYMPNDCRHEITTTISALDQAKAIAENRGGKPVWIVFTGSSIERGTMHALVDFVASIGLLENGEVKRSVADALFQNVEDVPGRRSTTKCWGWIDIQVGSIRISYQDARVIYQGNDHESDWADPIQSRWREILQEKPDLFVFGLFAGAGASYDLAVSQIVQAAADTNFSGLISLVPEKSRILSGGIDKTYSGAADSGMKSSIEQARNSLNKALSECRKSNHLNASQFTVSDEMLMAWAFVFDMERPMSDKMASQHFHRYVTEGQRSPQCGTIYSSRRYVIGAVAEMASQMYLGKILAELKQVNLSESPKMSDNLCIADFSQNKEEDFARQNPFRSCFTCPDLHGPMPWRPPSSPQATLSNPSLAKDFRELDVDQQHDGDIAFCYDPQKYSTKQVQNRTSSVRSDLPTPHQTSREIWVINQPKCRTGSLVDTVIEPENCNEEGINEQILLYRCPKHLKVFRTHHVAIASE